MSVISDRPARVAAGRRNPETATAATTRAVRKGADSRSRRSDMPRRQGALTGRAAAIGLAVAVGWGLFLWLAIAGSIAAFGNPWPHS